MTVISMIPSDTPYLPAKVTEVPKDVLRNFPHSKKVGNYLLGNTLGEGSFAKVKEALHIPTGERVAVKIIDKKKSREDSYVRRNLRREGKILQMIQHPNVVHLLEIMETQNSYYLVTELCRGGDLMDYISKKRKLSESEVKRYIRQIVSAVDYLHRLGILHRDLKIENLLLDEHRDMKIIDFGLSNCIKIVHSKEGTRAQELCVTQCGSPAYAAPELLGRKKYGPQVDIWSIGVNMYAMLTGNLPFTVEPFNIKALHTKMVNGQMNPMPDGISRDCRDIIKRFLNPDPERRITIEETLKHPWIAEAPGVPLTRAPCPNKVKTDSLDNSILKHMSENQGFRIGEIIRYVTGNIPSSATAMYCLILRRLNKHNGNMRCSGRISADYRLLQRAQQNQMNPSKEVSENNRRIMHYNHASPAPVTRVATSHTIKSVRNAVNTQQKLKETAEKNQSTISPENQNLDAEEDVFTDISKTANDSHITRAVSPSKQKKDNSNAKHVPTYFPSVATKYAITRRKTVNANMAPGRPSNGSDVTDGINNRVAAGHVESDEDRFRKRTSSFSGKAQRPLVELNQLLNGVGDEFSTLTANDAKHITNGVHVVNKADTNHETGYTKVNSLASPRVMSNFRTHSESIPVVPSSPISKSNNQYLLLYKKRETSANRMSVTTHPITVSKDMHSSKGSVTTEEEHRGSPLPKPLLSRPSRTNKIPRAKLIDHNGLNEELAHAHAERVSEISSTSTRPPSSRSTNVSSSSTRPTSPGLPTLPR